MMIMKKLIITGGQGSGKSALARKISEGMNVVTLFPNDNIQEFFERTLEEDFDFIIIEEAEAFNICTLNVANLFSHDSILNQKGSSVLIAIYQGEPIWSSIFPVYDMGCYSVINRRYEDPFLDAVEKLGRGLSNGPIILLPHDAN
jgi:hypothetical protein